MTTEIASLQARYAAEAGIWQTVYELLDERLTLTWSRNGRAQRRAIGGAEVDLWVQDQSGLIDLNGASPELMASLIIGVLPTLSSADAIAASIADWRDPDQLARDAGAEDAAYIAARRHNGAKDAPFHVVEEVQQVLGVTRAIFTAIVPFLTVHSQARNVRVEFSPRELRRILQDEDAPEAAQPAMAHAPGATAVGRAAVWTARVVAQAQINGATYVSSAVMMFDPRIAGGYSVLEWREPYALPSIAPPPLP